MRGGVDMKKENKDKEDKLKNYECDGQLCFIDIDMNIEEEPKDRK